MKLAKCGWGNFSLLYSICITRINFYLIYVLQNNIEFFIILIPPVDYLRVSDCHKPFKVICTPNRENSIWCVVNIVCLVLLKTGSLIEISEMKSSGTR